MAKAVREGKPFYVNLWPGRCAQSVLAAGSRKWAGDKRGPLSRGARGNGSATRQTLRSRAQHASAARQHAHSRLHPTTATSRARDPRARSRARRARSRGRHSFAARGCGGAVQRPRRGITTRRRCSRRSNLAPSRCCVHEVSGGRAAWCSTAEDVLDAHARTRHRGAQDTDLLANVRPDRKTSPSGPRDPTSRCAKALEADCASMTVPSRSSYDLARDRGETYEPGRATRRRGAAAHGECSSRGTKGFRPTTAPRSPDAPGARRENEKKGRCSSAASIRGSTAARSLTPTVAWRARARSRVPAACAGATRAISLDHSARPGLRTRC